MCHSDFTDLKQVTQEIRKNFTNIIQTSIKVEEGKMTEGEEEWSKP